jgi:hypothetical protein
MIGLYPNMSIMETRNLTKRAFRYRSFRLPDADLRLWIAAAGELGLSQSEFVRTAIREKASRTFRKRSAAKGIENYPRPVA